MEDGGCDVTEGISDNSSSFYKLYPADLQLINMLTVIFVDSVMI